MDCTTWTAADAAIVIAVLLVCGVLVERFAFYLLREIAEALGF